MPASRGWRKLEPNLIGSHDTVGTKTVEANQGSGTKSPAGSFSQRHRPQEVALRLMATSSISPVHSADNSPEDASVVPAEATPWTPPSWDEVVREHADRVYRLAYRLTGNRHDAEDLTQETFIRVFRSLASYKPGTFEGWLHRITTNLFLDMARRRSRLRMEGLPEDTDRLPGGGPTPEQVYHDTHLDPDLQTAMDELPPEFRAAVVLCDVEGLSYEEIGTTLGVKLGTVRSRIHRGRQMLKAALQARREHSWEDSA